eukprot:125961-Rhodomonas_salina.1
MLATNNSNGLLFTKIELIAKLAPLVPAEHREALNQESKCAAADLEHLQPFHGTFGLLPQSAPSALRDRLLPGVAGGASTQAGGPQAVPLAGALACADSVTEAAAVRFAGSCTSFLGWVAGTVFAPFSAFTPRRPGYMAARAAFWAMPAQC